MTLEQVRATIDAYDFNNPNSIVEMDNLSKLLGIQISELPKVSDHMLTILLKDARYE